MNPGALDPKQGRLFHGPGEVIVARTCGKERGPEDAVGGGLNWAGREGTSCGLMCVCVCVEEHRDRWRYLLGAGNEGLQEVPILGEDRAQCRPAESESP